MTTSQLVGQHVPYLRRYARILTGNQASGDSYVAATLEVLVKEPLAEHPRIALYQVFSRIWNSISRRRNAMSARLPRCPDRHSYLSRSKGFPKRTRLRFSTSIQKGCRIWSMSPDESLPLRLRPTFSLSKTTRRSRSIFNNWSTNLATRPSESLAT